MARGKRKIFREAFGDLAMLRSFCKEGTVDIYNFWILVYSKRTSFCLTEFLNSDCLLEKYNYCTTDIVRVCNNDFNAIIWQNILKHL